MLVSLKNVLGTAEKRGCAIPAFNVYNAETAMGVWPRMDIQPIERSLLYETYDEREEFTGLARKLIGNTLITKPEDLTCWLNKETLSDLYNS